MRIGLICPYDLTAPGGVQAQVLGLARTLRDGGDEAVVIGPGTPGDRDGVDLGGSVAISGNRSRAPISIDPRVWGRIASAVQGLDLIHVHEPLMPAVGLAALRSGPPVVATFHADPPRFLRGLYSRSGRLVRRVLGDSVRVITAVSRTAASALPGTLEVEIIPNGVDTAAMRSGVERRPGRIAFLGRDEPRKGLDVLLAAWPAIFAARPDAELVVMGADRGIDGIKWMGRVDDAVKAETLGSSEIYVAPNTGGESFGVVLVEAMAAGAVVVASDLAAFRDVGGAAARYFETGRPAELARTVVDLLADPETMGEARSAGVARAARYDWETVGDAYRDVYRRAVA